MTTAALAITATQRTTEALGILETMLTRRLGPGCRIRAIDHRPSACRSTFAIEEIDVLLSSGELLRLMLKTVGPRGLLPNARLAKPLYLHDPLREIEIYRHVLADRPHLGAAGLYSTVVERSCDRYWLLLERVYGSELDRVANLEGWRSAARWLAGMHVELAPLAAAAPGPGTNRLLRYDADFLKMWISRALATIRLPDWAVPPHLVEGMEGLARSYDRVVDRLTAMPTTILHGELYASNVLLGRAPSRVCAIDWEMAAIGPPLLDLAALIAGARDEARQRDLAFTYLAELPDDDPAHADPARFFEDLAFCRLHLAVQWLGWSPDSAPPRKEAHDWLVEVLRLGVELDL